MDRKGISKEEIPDSKRSMHDYILTCLFSAIVTNSIIEISEAEVQLHEWPIKTALVYVRQFTYRCGKTVAHAMVLSNIGVTSEF